MKKEENKMKRMTKFQEKHYQEEKEDILMMFLNMF